MDLLPLYVNNQNSMNFSDLVTNQRQYFHSGATRSLEFRLQALKSLKQAIRSNENMLIEALKEDLNKSESESYLCEIGIIYDEINNHSKHLRDWMKDKRKPTPIAQFKSKSFISPEPYGVVLIMAPWNYPVQLCISPLIGAISAGNCAILKPSAYAPTVSDAMAKIISEVFCPEYVTVVQGGRDQNKALLDEKFDYIFFTGSVAVGKVVMAAASKHLTPISLELGGKSPVIVDDTADIEIAARRIAFGKILNAGQTCIAPDYLFVHRDVKQQFVEKYRTAVRQFFPTGDYSDYPHIINKKHFERLIGLMDGESIIFGGRTDAEKRFIEPSLLDKVSYDAPIMQEEIFGPILPLIEYSDIQQCIDYIRSRPKPLALYLFTSNKDTEKRVLDTCSFGGGCINDTIIHIATPYMGFGGVGESGMGSYHGKFSFDTFSHYRSIVKKSFFPDMLMRYRPYTKAKDALVRRFLG